MDTVTMHRNKGIEYPDIIVAMEKLCVQASKHARLVGEGECYTLFLRTSSRPIHRMPLTPIQTYIWLLSQESIQLSKLINVISTRYPAIKPIDIAWAVADMRHEHFLVTMIYE